MDEPRHRRSADEKIDALYTALLGTLTTKGAIAELRDSIREVREANGLLSERLTKHEAEQKERDERAEERKGEVRKLLLGVAERSIVALIGALGGAWVAIQAVFAGKPQGQ